MTIYEVKRRHIAAHPESHFFDRKTMRFFGQTMRDFSVTRASEDGPRAGQYLVKAPMRYGVGQLGITGYTMRWYDPATGNLENCK